MLNTAGGPALRATEGGVFLGIAAARILLTALAYSPLYIASALNCHPWLGLTPLWRLTGYFATVPLALQFHTQGWCVNLG